MHFNVTPLTCNSVDCSVEPAEFDAMHLNIPLCFPLIDSMLKEDSRGDIRTTVSPFSPLTISWPLSDHFISSGKSPFVIIH